MFSFAYTFTAGPRTENANGNVNEYVHNRARERMFACARPGRASDNSQGV